MGRSVLLLPLVAALALASCAGSTCPGGSALVGGGCVQLATDNANCGAVGRACAAGTVCSVGQCAATCAAPLTTCGAGRDARCADARSDPANCGACGLACPSGQVCSAGACAPSCAAPLATCGAGAEARCVDPSSDPANCGACGAACPTGFTCSAGACAATCAGAGGTLCGGACVHLATDAAHCGACDVACGPGTTCAGGVCAPTCPAGQARCGDACVTLADDPAHCGACGNACPASAVCASGACAAVACRGEVGLPSVPDLVGSRTFSIAAGDVDGDGRTDLVIGEMGEWAAGNHVLLLRNLGGRRFAAARSFPAGVAVGGVRLADVGGDGLLDAIVVSDGMVSVLAGTADGAFAPPVTYPALVGAASGMAVGDVDGDGRADVVLGSYSLSVLRGQSLDRLDAARVFRSSDFWFQPTAVALADLDGDGWLDVVAGEHQGGRIGVYLNDGTGAFSDPALTPVGVEVLHVAAGDVDGDGHPDVVAIAVWYDASSADPYRWGVAVLRNRGDGTLEAPTFLETGFDPEALVLADLDGDGALDLAVGNWGDVRRVDVFRNAGDGTFLAPERYYDEGAADLVAVDLDGDGRRDLAVASGPGFAVHLLWNEGDGRLGQPPAYPGGIEPWLLSLADLDGDGRLDAVAVDNDRSGVVAWRGRGDGTFDPARPLEVPGWFMALGDVDGDRRADLVVGAAGAGGPELQVLLARGDGYSPGQVIPGSFSLVQLVDVDGDGRVDLLAASRDVVFYPGRGDGTFGDPVTVLTFGSAGSVLAMAVGDVDGDQRPDVIVSSFSFVYVARNLGDGRFGRLAYPATDAMGLAVGDLDGDGRPDLALIEPYEDAIGVMRGNGDGTFGPMRTIDLFDPESLAIAPLAGAGRPASLLVRGALTEDVGIVEVGLDGSPGAVRRWATRGGRVGNVPLAWGDLDGDLRPDVVVAAQGGIAVLRTTCLP